MSELKIDSERVLEASKKCSEAKRIFEELWPDLFKPKEEWEDVTDKLKIYSNHYTYGAQRDAINLPDDGDRVLYLNFGSECPFMLLPCYNHLRGDDRDYKIEGDRIYRLKK